MKTFIAYFILIPVYIFGGVTLILMSINPFKWALSHTEKVESDKLFERSWVTKNPSRE